MFRVGGAKEATYVTKKAIKCNGGVTFKDVSNMAQMVIENLVEPNIIKPADPAALNIPPIPYEIKTKKKWEMDYESYIKDLRA